MASKHKAHYCSHAPSIVATFAVTAFLIGIILGGLFGSWNFDPTGSAKKAVQEKIKKCPYSGLTLQKLSSQCLGKNARDLSEECALVLKHCVTSSKFSTIQSEQTQTQAPTQATVQETKSPAPVQEVVQEPISAPVVPETTPPAPAPAPVLKQMGQACSVDADCTTSKCASGVCKQNVFGSCTSSSDCASNLCNPANRQCMLSVGQSCQNDNECYGGHLPGHCASGTCKSELGGSCRRNTGDVDCLPNQNLGCFAMTGAASFCMRKNGGSCVSHSDCNSGLCVTGRCASCTSNSQCINAESIYCRSGLCRSY